MTNFVPGNKFAGYQVDKFKVTGLTPQPARQVKAPIIDECVAHMECKVRQEIETGDKNCLLIQMALFCR